MTTGAFLKVGSFGFVLAEKNERSDFASFAGAADLTSFLTATGFVEETVPTAGFFSGWTDLDGASVNFLFLTLLGPASMIQRGFTEQQTDMTHPLHRQLVWLHR